MTTAIDRLAIGAAALLISATTVQAQTVSSNVEGSVGGAATVSDPQGPSTTGDVQSSGQWIDGFDFDFAGPAFGEAAQRLSGVGAVAVEGLFADGSQSNAITATTTWTDSATNNSAGPTSFSFTFLISPAELSLRDFAGLEITDPVVPEAEFELSITANGVQIFQSSALLRGGNISHSLTETGTSLGPVAGPSPGPVSYDFQPFGDVLALGTFNPGESVTVIYEMRASIDSPGFETGGRARVGDPFDLDGMPGFTGSIIPDNPVATSSSSWGQLKSLYDN